VLSRFPLVRVARAGIVHRFGRFSLCGLAVLLGVAFLTASLTLTNTIRASFDALFAGIYRQVDLQVRPTSDLLRRGVTYRGRMAEATLTAVAQVPGVERARAVIGGVAYLVDGNGKTIGDDDSSGADPIVGNFLADEDLGGFHLVAGRAPQQRNEVVIDRRTSRKRNLPLGQTTTLLTKNETLRVTVVGIVRFGTTDSPGGAPVLLLADSAAQQLIGKPGFIDAVHIRVASGSSTETVRQRLGAVLPSTIEAVTGEQVSEERQAGLHDRLQFLDAFLLLFAVLSVLVGTFLIANTFAITVAQRGRELALLRALGAARAQIRRLVLGEALAVGITATALGIACGLLLASALLHSLDRFGIELPSTNLALKPSIFATAVAVGVGTTLAAAILPARRAARLAPLAALRDVAFERRPVRLRTIAGALVCLGGVLVVMVGAARPSVGLAGLGTLILLAGTVIVAPGIAAPTVRALSWGVSRLGGAPGKLARRNTTRNPRRTATTALALTLGTAVGCLAVVLNASLARSLQIAITGGVKADLVVRGGAFGIGGLPTSLGRSVAKLPQVGAVTPVRFGFAKVAGPKRTGRRAVVIKRDLTRPIGAVDPATADSLVDLGRVHGRFADLGNAKMGMSEREADERGWNVGDRVTLQFPGRIPAVFELAVIFKQTLAFDFVIAIADYATLVDDQFDFLLYVGKAPGVSVQQLRTALTANLSVTPLAKVETLQEVSKRFASSLDQLLALIAALLALSIVIAMIGIAINLVLAVHERTREIGLLRIVGMARKQTRQMIRWEAIVLALFGGLLGMVLGAFIGWGLTRALRAEGLGEFALPWRSLGALAVIAGLAGLLAAVVPARRAAHVNMIAAVAAE
jgi:putative ABC transport system permease protein